MRVGAAALQQSMLLELQRAQNQYYDAQSQVATGKIGTGLADYGTKAELASAGRLAQARAEQRIALAGEAENRFNAQAITLKNVTTVASDFHQSVMNALGTNSGIGLQESLNTAFTQAAAAFNFQFDGKYLFGGTRMDTPPVNVASLAALAAAPSVASIFENNATKPTMDLGDGPLEVGQLASDVSTSLFTVIKTIKDYIDLNGPFSTPLTQAQSTFLTTQLGPLQTASADMVAAEGVNGFFQKRAETVKLQQDDVRIALTTFVSNVEDADIVDATARMQANQLAYEAAAQTLAQLSRLSLLDFLR
jgi:flagellar hook-associated protein 3 FlgL